MFTCCLLTSIPLLVVQKYLPTSKIPKLLPLKMMSYSTEYFGHSLSKVTKHDLLGNNSGDASENRYHSF